MTVYTTGGSESVVSEDGDAADVTYDNTDSGLAATNVQDAIDELTPRIYYCTSDLVKTSDAVLAADPVLAAPLLANSQYVIEILVMGDTNSTADWNADCNYTGTLASVFWNWEHFVWTTSGIAGGTASTTSGQWICGSGINQSHAVANTGTQTNCQKFTYRVQTTTAGTFQYRWCQTVSNGTGSTRRKDSFMRVTRVPS